MKLLNHIFRKSEPARKSLKNGEVNIEQLHRDLDIKYMDVISNRMFTIRA